jgi:hypothetical protein
MMDCDAVVVASAPAAAEAVSAVVPSGAVSGCAGAASACMDSSAYAVAASFSPLTGMGICLQFQRLTLAEEFDRQEKTRFGMEFAVRCGGETSDYTPAGRN